MLHAKSNSNQPREIAERRKSQGRYVDIKVVVLGASGFIGRWVARALSGEGARIYLVVRDKAAAEEIVRKYNIGAEIISTDLSDFVAVRNVLREISPKITFNVAGYGVDRSECDEKTAYQINAGLIGVICETISEIKDLRWPGQDLVHVGSALEYGTTTGNLYESSVANPTTLYGRSKLAGTQLLTAHCRAFGIKGLTARLFTVYGPGEHKGRLLPSLLETAVTERPLSLTAGNQRRDFTYVEDVAEGLVCLGLASANAGEIVNLATGTLTSVRSFAETAAKTLHFSTDFLKFGTLPSRPEEMEHSEVCLTRLRQVIAWAPLTRIADGILKTWKFQRTA